jgi:hypothetical protein
VEFEDRDEWQEEEAWKGESHVQGDTMRLVGEFKFEADNSNLGGAVSVRLRDLPFAQGGERNAYHMFIDAHSSTDSAGDRHYVAKESRMEERFKNRLKFHLVSFYINLLDNISKFAHVSFMFLIYL